jgi:hypothetical protein
MRRSATILRPTLFLPWLGAAACATAGPRIPSPAPSAAAGDGATTTAGFDWTGVYELEGHDFPEGSRRAVVTITPRGRRYAVDVLGPPGRLGSAQFVGDSAHIVWDFVTDGPTLRLRLHGAGDSLTGWWTMAELTGPLVGRRRR